MRNFDKIKALAAAKNLKLADVASAVGISYQQLNRIIRTHSTSIETLGKIAETLAVPASFFIDDNVCEVISVGDDSPGAGKGNSVNPDLSEALLKAFDEIAAQRRMTEKAQAQIDDLIEILKTKLQ